MRSRVRRLRRYFETHGAQHTAAAIGRLLRELVYKDARFIVLVQDLHAIVEPGRDCGLRVEELEASRMPELAKMNRMRGRPDTQRLFERYLDEGFHGFLAYQRDELIGYYWWIDRDVPAKHTDLNELGLGIDLGEQDVYGSHFFLLEERRGGGVSGDMLFKVESALRNRGFGQLWGYVVDNNRPARWAYSTRGYKPMWVVRLRRFLGIQWAIREPL